MLKTTDRAVQHPRWVEKIFDMPKYKNVLFENSTELSKHIKEEFGVKISIGTLNCYFREGRIKKDIIRRSVGYNTTVVGLRSNVMKYLKNNGINEKEEESDQN